MQIRLFPHSLKPVGWILFTAGTILGLLLFIFPELYDALLLKLPSIVAEPLLAETQYFSLYEASIIPLLAGILMICGALLIGFSREIIEDEYTGSIRLKALQRAFIFHCILLMISLLFIREMALLKVLLFNFFAMLLFFVINYEYLIYQIRKMPADEESC